MKSAFVAIIGRPSAGKSTFLNKVCGKKVSIVSPHPQTTRHKVRGIWNAPGGAGQLVFVDTPGFHTSTKKFNSYMKKLVHASLGECDLVLYLMDITRRPGEEEAAIMRIAAESGLPVVIGLNKTDMWDTVKEADANREEMTREADAHFSLTPVIPMSAASGDGIKEVLAALLERAPEGPAMYPDDFYTDQPPDFRIAEIIREKAIMETSQELPHCIYVEILDMEMHEDDSLLWVRGLIHVERESQKGILIGKKGEKIRKIMDGAHKEIAPLFPYPVELDFRVRVKPKWRRNDGILKTMFDE